MKTVIQRIAEAEKNIREAAVLIGGIKLTLGLGKLAIEKEAPTPRTTERKHPRRGQQKGSTHAEDAKLLHLSSRVLKPLKLEIPSHSQNQNSQAVARTPQFTSSARNSAGSTVHARRGRQS